MDSERFGLILTRARRRTDAADYPELPELRHKAGLTAARGPGGRRLSYLSQVEISLLLGYDASRGIYARLERGLIANPSDELLRRIATILNLQEHQWHDLYIAAFGHRAPSPLRPASMLALHDSWNWAIQGQEHPAYISDGAWNVLTYNEAANALFNPMPQNVMRWMLSLPPQEDSRAAMPGWAEGWGPVALSQLASALHERRKAHEELRQIEREVLQHPDLKEMYESVLDSCIHPDGSRRLMVHGTRREIGVLDAAAGTPVGVDHGRVIFMKWTPVA
ncbi:helix-turn-helix transcriptional regulator [Streptomyces spectabilis]|uniref:Transcriptional regulator with XRE-family HTH domain n=1 Tax=Streptomyces spectabilis TaxID=68270 RepID=A0A5P2XIH1_STRST|nr:helix-turn-helix transcriptional regulator [Streptomyces spectabilis]MBB5102624.1 transcriptional regulator with XRE-family HTH domain [Streptomyces spectabilis]MCI3907663.1 helix-turn-helix transcriptional regulator [Streptomyces spectabilis]QEV64341.1 XRE family transcriptional regulator [Streptomyces spectabilis]GGV30747.1 hypothetical protein GCM10010245_49740 [Streptomyces spectabilis]